MRLKPRMNGGGLIQALAAEQGLVCVVGAGGKKTTMYRLASLHAGRVGITSTVFIPPPAAALAAKCVIAPEPGLFDAVLELASRNRMLFFAQPSDKPGRFAGVSAFCIAQIHRQAMLDVTFVKADGARSRWLKAPAEDEPQIPGDANTVIPVVSALALGRPLDESIAHRVERLASVMGIRRGELILPTHLARLLSDGMGALKQVGDATVVPLINMVDDPEHERLAHAVAREALARSSRFERVVLAAMRKPESLVAVVTR
ncbi:MAG: selenium cofactor biosynthesis protein YqeC [Gammaproteobacteria bacterium]